MKEILDAFLDKPERFNKFLDNISQLDSTENQSILLYLLRDVQEYFKNMDIDSISLFRNKGLLDIYPKLCKMLVSKLFQASNNHSNPISFEVILKTRYWL